MAHTLQIRQIISAFILWSISKKGTSAELIIQNIPCSKSSGKLKLYLILGEGSLLGRLSSKLSIANTYYKQVVWLMELSF